MAKSLSRPSLHSATSLTHSTTQLATSLASSPVQSAASLARSALQSAASLVGSAQQSAASLADSAPRSATSITHSATQSTVALASPALHSMASLTWQQSAGSLVGSDLQPPESPAHSAPQSSSSLTHPLADRDHSKSKEEIKHSPSKDEPMKMDDLPRKKLTTIETQRVVAVMDETIKSVELVSLFLYTVKNLDRFGVVLGCELSGAIREHQRLQDSMLSLLSRMDNERAEQQGSLEEDKGVGIFWQMEERGRDKLSLLQQAISSSVKNTLRLFHTNHAAAEAIRAEGHARSAAIKDLIQALWELQGFLFEKLLTSPQEQNDQIHHLNELIKKDQKNTDKIKVLEADLDVAIKDRDGEIAKKNDVIRQLKIQLYQLEKFSDDHIRRMKQEADNQQKSDQRVSENNCTKLQQELQRKRAQLNSEIAEHKEIEMALRKKKYKVETEIENWIQKFDSEMGEKQTELEELEAVYEEEEAQHEELKEKMALLEKEYLQIVEERRLAQEKKEAEEKELAILTRAATLIQAIWKGYLVRKLLGPKKKKKGKKGKKGKGKKGKGKKGKK
ncbi:hypothetical protein NDU88_005514 [Pleurodeles waltl]|uniref:Dynein regulatory complex protein 10 n=2 Tax=Pleurodeles waltl TaxID=8319 RepID=A0AAV7LPR1_PLEWA|nr:hypothetical protein NDU88_005514 [Pleurodeles waltl]